MFRCQSWWVARRQRAWSKMAKRVRHVWFQSRRAGQSYTLRGVLLTICTVFDPPEPCCAKLRRTCGEWRGRWINSSKENSKDNYGGKITYLIWQAWKFPGVTSVSLTMKEPHYSRLIISVLRPKLDMLLLRTTRQRSCQKRFHWINRKALLQWSCKHLPSWDSYESLVVWFSFVFVLMNSVSYGS